MNSLNISNEFKFNIVKSQNIIKFNRIQVPKIKIYKLTFFDKNENYYNELFTKIPYHSQR